MPADKAPASTWKTWADSNLDYYTNFVAAATTTTLTPYAGRIWTLLNESGDPVLYNYYPLQQADIENPTAAAASSPLGGGQSRQICSLAQSEAGLVDVTPSPIGDAVPAWNATETGTVCNGGDTSY